MFFSTFGDHYETDFRQQAPVDNSRLYNLLGISKDANQSDIKKAYRALAIKHHPDKGGDPEKFKEITQAYEILSDPNKKSVYDQRGEAVFEQGGGGGESGVDLLDLLFGGGGREGGQQGKSKGDDIKSTIHVTLDQVYNGHTKKVAVTRNRICNDCEGRGAPEELIEKCNSCRGTGVMKISQRIGPMVQQYTRVCTKCNGKGKRIPDDALCKKCNGVGTIKDRKIFEVFVEKGIPDDHKIYFNGEANQAFNQVPGDIIFTVNIEKHQTFERATNHLIIEKSILLSEALLGTKFVLKHLDGRDLIIQSAPGELIRPNETKAISEEGMPYWKRPFTRGYLFIRFEIIFPPDNSFTNEMARIIKEILPYSTPKINGHEDDYENHILMSVNMEEAMKSERDPDRSSDEEGGGQQRGGGRLQCPNQ